MSWKIYDTGAPRGGSGDKCTELWNNQGVVGGKAGQEAVGGTGSC